MTADPKLPRAQIWERHRAWLRDQCIRRFSAVEVIEDSADTLILGVRSGPVRLCVGLNVDTGKEASQNG